MTAYPDLLSRHALESNFTPYLSLSLSYPSTITSSPPPPTASIKLKTNKVRNIQLLETIETHNFGPHPRPPGAQRPLHHHFCLPALPLFPKTGGKGGGGGGPYRPIKIGLSPACPSPFSGGEGRPGPTPQSVLPGTPGNKKKKVN